MRSHTCRPFTPRSYTTAFANTHSSGRMKFCVIMQPQTVVFRKPFRKSFLFAQHATSSCRPSRHGMRLPYGEEVVVCLQTLSALIRLGWMDCRYGISNNHHAPQTSHLCQTEATADCSQLFRHGFIVARLEWATTPAMAAHYACSNVRWAFWWRLRIDRRKRFRVL